jgi:hypothetical protein
MQEYKDQVSFNSQVSMKSIFYKNYDKKDNVHTIEYKDLERFNSQVRLNSKIHKNSDQKDYA